MKHRLGPTLLSLVLLAGCTNAWFYDQLDWLVPWYVEDYVDLTREQNRNLKEQLVPLLDWHRKEELAEYLALLERVEADLQQPLSAEVIESWIEAATVALNRLELRVLPLAFDLGDQLSDEQMQEFLDKLWERQTELETEYLARTDEEYVEESYENFEENMAQFLGRLSDAQKQRLQAAAASLTRFDAAWLADRKTWLEMLQAVLQERAPGWHQQIRDALASREERQSTEYRTIWLQNQARINSAVADVLNDRSDAQSERLQKEIDAIKDDLVELIAKAD